MKVVFINTPCNQADTLDDTWYIPLGLVHIASLLEENGLDVEIVDGIVLGHRKTLERCSGHIIGITFNSFNVEDMEAVAKEAKSQGAFTVVGGHAASAVAGLLLEQNRNINAVVVGDGEWAMLELAKSLTTGGDLSNVPNLVYRMGQNIVCNSRLELPLSSLPMPRRDVGGLDLESYIERYAFSCSDPIQEKLRPTNVVTRKGCPRRAAGKGCSFCARIDRKVRTRTPMQAWQEYKYLVEELGANYLYEDSDSWINIGWLRQLQEIWGRNGGLDVRFRVYGDIRDVTSESTELMRQLNVDTVLTGIESGDRNVLMQNGKDFAYTNVELACRQLSDAGIRIADAYVLGLIGESWFSIDRTIALSEKIHSMCEVAATYWNIMLPLPGSPSWRTLLEASPLSQNFSRSYRLDIDAVRREFFNRCTELGPGALEKLEALRTELCKKSLMPVGEYIR